MSVRWMNESEEHSPASSKTYVPLATQRQTLLAKAMDIHVDNFGFDVDEFLPQFATTKAHIH